MKKIAVFINQANPLDYSLSKPMYWKGYTELSEAVSEQGGELYFVCQQHTYLGNGHFSYSWQIKNSELIETGPVNVSVVFDKGSFDSDNTVPVINDPAIREFCLDKWLIYQEFSRFCPKTFQVNTEDMIKEVLSQISTEKIVFKPTYGAEGYGVIIEDRDYFEQNAKTLILPGLIQEFLDTSQGIPGIVEGYHDLRIILIDGQIQCAYVRTPPEGSLLANVAQGGDLTVVSPENIPGEVVNICDLVDKYFSHHKHRIYSIDFGYTIDGPKIIEMNSQPAMFPNEMGASLKKFKEKIASVLLDY